MSIFINAQAPPTKLSYFLKNESWLKLYLIKTIWI